jgi:hypothetical protein
MNRNGYYTSEDLKRSINLKGQCTFEIIPCHDGFTYIWIKKNPDRFTNQLPISPITQEETQGNIHLVNTKLYPSQYWNPIFSSQEITIRWVTGDELSRHVTIEEALYWISINL